jgi:hypothetical protein
VSLPGGPIGGVFFRKYGALTLLAALLVQFILVPVAATWHSAARFFVDAWFLLIIISAVFAGEGGKLSLRRPGVWLFGLIVVLRSTLIAWDESPAEEASGLIAGTEIVTAVVMFWMCVAILRNSLRGKSVTLNGVAGVASVYIIMALAFAHLHMAVFFIDADYYTGFADPGRFPLREMMPEFIYYSTVTMTTLGYGEIVPTHSISRGISMVETFAGQLYLAVVLARIVAVELSQRTSPSAK